MLTGTEMMRTDLRRMRAEPLMHAILEAVRPYMRDERDMRYLYDEIVKPLREAGVELLTDHMRADLGLPPRGPDGWTRDEILALEKARIDAITRPISFSGPANMLPEVEVVLAASPHKD